MKAREYKTNTNTNTQRSDKPTLQLTGYNVLRTRVSQNGTPMADVEINGITIYSMSVMANKSSGEVFLSWPSTKGKDGKYYSSCYARLSDSDQEAIIKAIYDHLDANS